jgi:hypothetical protein
VEAAGIEPAGETDANNSTANVCENQPIPSAANALHDSDSNWLNLSSIDAALRAVIVAWDSLPQRIRQAIQMLAVSQSTG